MRKGQDESAALFMAAASQPGSPLGALLGVGKAVLDGDECQDAELWLECALAALRDSDGIGRHHRELVGATVRGIEMMLERAQASDEIGQGLDLPTIALLLYSVTLGLKAQGPAAVEPGHRALDLAMRMLRATAGG